MLAPRLSWLAALMLAGCGGAAITYPPPVIPPIEDTQILSNRIGPVSIGMSEADLLKYLGVPTETLSFQDGSGARYGYHALGLNVRVDRGRVTTVGTGEARYTMPNGLHPKSAEIELRVKMGEPARRKPEPTGLYTELCYPDGTKVLLAGAGVNPEIAGKVMTILIGSSPDSTCND